jgi:hypothetical protein
MGSWDNVVMRLESVGDGNLSLWKSLDARLRLMACAGVVYICFEIVMRSLTAMIALRCS